MDKSNDMYTDAIKRLLVLGYTDDENVFGVHAFDFCPESGRVVQIAESEDMPNTSFGIERDGNLFVASESSECGRVCSYNLNQNQVPQYINCVEFEGESETCFTLVSANGQCVYAANYSSGSFCATQIRDGGELGRKMQLIKHFGVGHVWPRESANFERQNGAHVHTLSFVPGTKYLAAVDLGLDCIVIYDIDDDGFAVGSPFGTKMSGFVEKCDSFDDACENELSNRRFSVEPAAVVVFPAGSGPRIVAYHPTEPIAAVVCELSCELMLFRISEGGLHWECFQRVDLLQDFPEVRVGEACANSATGRPPLAAHAEFSRDGCFLYTSTRGTDVVSVFEVDEEGGVRLLENYPSGGNEPRHFALSPNGGFLAVANQMGNTVRIFSRNVENGMLEEALTIPVHGPSCVAWL